MEFDIAIFTGQTFMWSFTRVFIPLDKFLKTFSPDKHTRDAFIDFFKLKRKYWQAFE